MQTERLYPPRYFFDRVEETKYVGLLSTREPCMCAIKRSSAFSLLINPIYSRDDPRNGFAVNNSALSD